MIDKIEYWWRHHVVYPALRHIFRNPERSTPIDITSIKSILILRYDRIGDMIITTPIFKGLKTANPTLRLGVISSKANEEIVRHNPYIDVLYVLPARWWHIWKFLKNARNEHYDVVLNFIFNRTTSGGILANLIAPEGIKVGQGEEKYRFYFNILLKLSRDTIHMVDILRTIIKDVFALELSDKLQFEIIVDNKTRENVKEYLTAHNLRPRNVDDIRLSPYILFNLSANDPARKVSPQQALSIGEYLSSIRAFRTLLINAPDDPIMFSVKQRLVQETRCLAFPDQGIASLLATSAIIEGALAVITPDTSIIHFASAAKTPVIGFYTTQQQLREWLPYQVKHKILRSDNSKPVSIIPIQRMIQTIDEFIQEIQT